MKKGKYKSDKENQHNVMYQIECKNCEANYIGQTKRALKTRIKEHKNNINTTDPDKHSVITLHRLKNDHDMKWDSVQILDLERNYQNDVCRKCYI